MSALVILNYKDPRIQFSDYRSQIDAIFFEASTKKEFKDAQDKAAFNWKYLGFYLSHYPEYAWIAVRDLQLLGYVVGMPFSHDPSLYKIQPHMMDFAEEFKNYPAHLHINCHESSRGMGVGKLLTLQLIEQLKQQGVKGLHIMTGPTSDNRYFYSKLGFNFEHTKNSILFMGRDL